VVNCIHEHHANFLPWYARAQLRTIPIDTNGLVDLALLEAQLQHSPKLISISWASNVTGNLQPIQDIVALAHRYNCLVCIDGAQIVGHRTVDLGKLEPDFFVCSSHKMFGPTGAGLLYIHEKHLDTLPYTRFGGGMVNAFDGKHCQFKRAPLGFEPGTPAIEAIFGFAKAIAYIQSIGYERIQQHCQQWSGAFMQQLEKSRWCLSFPRSADALAVFSLRPRQGHCDLSQLARILSDSYNIGVGEGQSCCGPLYASFKQTSALRVSAQIYNPLSEVERFFACLDELSYMIMSD